MKHARLNVFGVSHPKIKWSKIYRTRGAATSAMFRGYIVHLEVATWREEFDQFSAANTTDKKRIAGAAGWRVVEYRLEEVSRCDAI